MFFATVRRLIGGQCGEVIELVRDEKYDGIGRGKCGDSLVFNNGRKFNCEKKLECNVSRRKISVYNKISINCLILGFLCCMIKLTSNSIFSNAVKLFMIFSCIKCAASDVVSTCANFDT